MQIKATDHPKWLREQDAFAVRVERQDLLLWNGEEYPVMLVLYDASADRAHWLHMQDEFQGGKIFGLERQGATVTVHIPRSQVMNEEAVEQFRRLKRQTAAE